MSELDKLEYIPITLVSPAKANEWSYEEIEKPRTYYCSRLDLNPWKKIEKYSDYMSEKRGVMNE